MSNTQHLNNNNTGNDFNTAEILSDHIIAEGDEHHRQINGGQPSASVLSIENIETENAIMAIAPAEGEKPLSFFFDKDFEVLSNPDKFPLGKGAFSTERPIKLTYRRYFQQRLLNQDGRFSQDLDYLFTAQYIVEAKQIFDDMNCYIWRQRPQDSSLTAREVRDPRSFAQYVRKDKAYRFLKNVRGSPPYFQRTLYELLAMVRQFGTPTWFFTVSAADLKG